MKKVLLLLFSMTLLFVGCSNNEEETEHSLFDFRLDEIESIDVYRMSSARVFLNKKILDNNDIENIYYSFDEINLDDNKLKLTNTVIGLPVYTFSFNLKNDEYVLSFTDNGEGGIITFFENGNKYYTNNEVEECWENIAEKEVLVDEAEVPQIKK